MQRKEFYIFSTEYENDLNVYEDKLKKFDAYIEQLETDDMLSCATIHIPVWKVRLSIAELTDLQKYLGKKVIIHNEYDLYAYNDDYDVIHEFKDSVIEIYDGYRE